MKNTKARHLRTLVQASVITILIIIIAVYNLYTGEILNFKILGIGDLNPYGGWSAIKESATDSGYIFEGISKSMSLTIALAALAILGGRYFCGWLCPVGAIQDFASWLGSKTSITRYNSLNHKGFNPLWFKYPFLLSILILSILGYGAMMAELSPWRAFLSLPKIVSAWSEIKIGFIILAAAFIASIFLPRFFCRYLCPLGAAQALFSSFCPLSMKHSEGCKHCNKCLNDCPVGIRFSPENNTISPECIKCMKCVENCSVSKDIWIRPEIRDKAISVNAYSTLMIVLFIFIWLGIPHLFGGSISGEDIKIDSLRDGTYQGEAKGFAGRIITEVNITEGKISNISVIEHQESKGWYEEVYMILPREIISKQRLHVDAISGATKTSKGLVKSIENALKKAK